MRCCVNRLLFNSLVGVPPDISPPDESAFYYYQIAIQGFNPATDEYQGANINGVEYSNNIGTMDIVDLWFVADLAEAGYIIGPPDCDASARSATNTSDDSPAYWFYLLSSGTASVTVHLVINGVPVDVALTGGAAQQLSFCSTVVGALGNNYTDLVIQSQDHGGGTMNVRINSSGTPFDTAWQTTAAISPIDTNTIIGWQTTLIDNGGGNGEISILRCPVTLVSAITDAITFNPC